MQTRTSVGRDFQDNILGRLIDRHQVATIFLRNRMSLRGRVLEIDPYVLFLEPLDGSPPQMVYKSAIVSISIPRPMGGRRPDSRGPRDGARYEGPRHEGPPPPRFREPRAGLPRPEGGYPRPEGGFSRPEGGFSRPEGPPPRYGPPKPSQGE